MSQVVNEDDLVILLKAGLSQKDIRHSILVSEKALDIAKRTGKDLDLEAEQRFEEIITHYRGYGKDKPTSDRYLGYHREISKLIDEAKKLSSEKAL